MSDDTTDLGSRMMMMNWASGYRRANISRWSVSWGSLMPQASFLKCVARRLIAVSRYSQPLAHEAAAGEGRRGTGRPVAGGREGPAAVPSPTTRLGPGRGRWARNWLE